MNEQELTTAPLDVPASADACTRFLDRAEDIRRRHTIAAVLELGRAAVQELYAGDLARFRDRAFAQGEPLAELMAHHGERMQFLGLTPDKLRAAIGAYDTDLQLPPQVRGCLNPSQLRTLGSIPSPVDRAMLAVQAADDRWTSEQTEQAVASYRIENGLQGKGGPKPRAPELKHAEAASRKLAAVGDPSRAQDLPLGTQIKLLHALNEMDAVVQAWRKALGR